MSSAPQVVELPVRHEGGTVLAAEAITKRWPRHERPVLDAVDLQLEAGEVIGLYGRNGIGKTTLLRILAGLIGPDAGSVHLLGRDPWADRRAYQRDIGFLAASNGGLYARLKVRENLGFAARLALLPRHELRSAIAAGLADFELEDLADVRTDRLSMGQRQRVRLALAFLHAPRLLLLDEPANSLDDDAIELLVRNVERHSRRGGGAIWCAPSPSAIHAPVDRRLALTDGSLECSSM